MATVALRVLCVVWIGLSPVGTAWAQSGDDDGAVGGEVLEETLVTPPRLKRHVQPRYPEEGLGVGVSVVLQIDIDIEGQVQAVEVIERVSEQAREMGFEAEALRAARQWVFEPALRHEQPVAVQIKYTLHFKPPVLPKPEADKPSLNFVGRVLERGTREPLVGVRVVVFRGEGERAQGFEALVDKEGIFAFYGLETGTWRVAVEPEGYAPLRVEEVIAEGERLEVVYRLEREAYNQFDILVEGERGKSTATRRQISVEEMAYVPGVYGDPLKVLRMLPGVAQTSAFTSDIVIRGGDRQDTRFFTMGLPVPAAFHFGGIRGLFPEGMVEKLVLYPGNMPVYYGRSIAGAIDIVLPDKVGEQTHGYVDVSLLDATLYMEVPASEDVWVAGSARRSYYDALIGAVGISVSEDLVLPAYWDLHVQAGWRPSEAPEHELRWFLFSADDEFVVYSLKDEPDVEDDSLPETSMIQGGVRHSWVPNKDVEWASSLLVGWDKILELESLSGLFFVPALSGQRIETKTLNVAGRSNVSARLDDVASVQLGIDAVWSDRTLGVEPDLNNVNIDENGDFVGGLPDGFPTTFDQTFVEIAGYVETELAWPGSGLSVVPGVRFDHFGQLNANTLDPRLRLQYAPHSDWTLRGAVGVMHQAPRPAEQVLTTIADDLKPERALQTSVGVAWKPESFIEAELVGFYKKLDDLVALEDSTQLIWNNSQRGRTYGAEVLLRWPPRHRFNGWLAYTWSRSERWNETIGDYTLYAYDQTHNLTVFGSYRLPWNWSVGSRFRYATGFPVFSELGLGKAVGRLDDFHQLDIRVDKTWVYDTWTLLAYFDIQNVYNNFDYSGTESNGDSAEALAISPGVPILPIIGVKGEF